MTEFLAVARSASGRPDHAARNPSMPCSDQSFSVKNDCKRLLTAVTGAWGELTTAAEGCDVGGDVTVDDTGLASSSVLMLNTTTSARERTSKPTAAIIQGRGSDRGKTVVAGDVTCGAGCA